jgi:uncharacterized protein (TIGR03067 family)
MFGGVTTNRTLVLEIRMRTLVLMFVAVGLWPLVGMAKEPKDDQANIQGTWRIQSLEQGDTKAPEALIKNIKYVFTKDKLAVKFEDGKDEEGTFKLEPTNKPKWITVVRGDKTDLGIYVLEGDTLKVCVAEKGGRDRPTEFAVKPNSKQSLLVLKREKP